MRKKKQKWQELQKVADRLYQEVLLSENKVCFGCGRHSEVIHHFIPKSLSAYLRYDDLNGIPLCGKCHFSHHSKYDPEIILKVKEKMGRYRLSYLRNHRKDEERWTRQVGYYEKIIEDLNFKNGN